MIKVSIIVATYNHEKYIAKALESIVSQKADFEFEAIVGDDASKDNTAQIITDLANKYPEIIKPVLRKKNLGPFKNFYDLCMRAKGEYIAFLEGDDFWIDDDKLKKQINFLDSNKDYAACFGKCIIVDENDIRQEETEKYTAYFDGGEYTKENLEEYFLPGQTATSVYRKSVIFDLLAQVKKNKKILPKVPIADIFLILGVLSKGRIRTHKDRYAAYRYIIKKGSGSWSSKHDNYSLLNVIFFLYCMKELERVGKILGVNICFDEKRKYEFSKVADYKGQIPLIAINIIRFFIWIWYKDKKDFSRFMKERHK